MWVEILFHQCTFYNCRHPPREDVSWNKSVQVFSVIWIKSSSSWGCELKWLMWDMKKRCFRHPPREDVSWNTSEYGIRDMIMVILLVRMWVEMEIYSERRHEWASSSSWGCELKYPYYMFALHSHTVILLVRMWVEIAYYFSLPWYSWSSSSWGCELK